MKRTTPQHDIFYQQLGENIQKCRKGLKLSQAELANIVGLTRTSLTNIEKGRQHPPLHTLCEIVKHLNISVLDVLPRPASIKEPFDIKEIAMKNQSLGDGELAFIETAIKGGEIDGYTKKQNQVEDRKNSN